MKPNYFTIHKNKKAKKAKYSSPYTKKQKESIEQFTQDLTNAVERIKLNHGTAMVDVGCSPKTIDALNEMVDKAYDMDNSSENKSYREINFGFGDLDSAVRTLNLYKENNELVFGVFNGEKLYSDIDDLDSAYVKVTGQTKAECEEAERKLNEEYHEQQRKHEEAIPELTKEWIEKGKAILDEKYLELWNKCVPIRLGDLYQGMELGNCLDIVEQLNKGEELEKVKPFIENQGHSGMSFGLVCSMVNSFCDRGKEFTSYVRDN